MPTGLRYSGADVRIAHDGRLWVLVPAGVVGKAAAWKPVRLDQVRLDISQPHALITQYARHPVDDIGLDVAGLSHVLGLPRCDPGAARSLWKAVNSLRGDVLAVDFDRRELVSSAAPDHIYPFGAIAAATADPPGLKPKVLQPGMPAALPVGEFPIELRVLAEIVINRLGDTPSPPHPSGDKI